jgi:uncharacterized pyridoxal phosphate-dependent enzyme
MDVYEELGVRPVINACGSATIYGGSLMAPEVLDTMRAASQQFCLLDELHEKVGQKIAALLDVEAAYVTSSASCGLVLTTASCIAGTDPARIAQLPDTTGMKNEVLLQKAHRIGYDQALRVPGATLVEIADDGTPPVAAMRAALNKNTAAVFCLATAMENPASMPFEQVVDMAHAASVPVIVDAASECPPLSTLTRFSRAGADLVIFSGGKSIMGPQSTGLIIGRSDLIKACAANGNPYAAIGRPMKVSREEIIAFVKALELYLGRDHDADRKRWEDQLRHIEEVLSDIAHVEMDHFIKGETCQVPMLHIRLGAGAGITCGQIAAELKAGEPRIVIAEHFREDGVVINPHMLQPGQERIVAERCKEVLTRSA